MHEENEELNDSTARDKDRMLLLECAFKASKPATHSDQTNVIDERKE
jgi:hypothetical protein